MSNDDTTTAGPASALGESTPATSSAMAEQGGSTIPMLDTAADAAGTGAGDGDAPDPTSVTTAMDIDTSVDASRAIVDEQAQQPPQHAKEPSIAAGLEAPSETANGSVGQEVAGGSDLQQGAEQPAADTQQTLQPDVIQKPIGSEIVEPNPADASASAATLAPESAPAPEPQIAPQPATEPAPETAPTLNEPQQPRAQQQSATLEEGELSTPMATADASLPKPSNAATEVQGSLSEPQESTDAKASLPETTQQAPSTLEAPLPTSERDADADAATQQGSLNAPEAQAEQQAPEPLEVQGDLSSSLQASLAQKVSEINVEVEGAGPHVENEQAAEDAPATERKPDGDVEMSGTEAQAKMQQEPAQEGAQEEQRETAPPVEGAMPSETTEKSAPEAEATASEPAVQPPASDVQASEAPQADGMALDEAPQQQESAASAPVDQAELAPPTLAQEGDATPAPAPAQSSVEAEKATNGHMDHDEAPSVIRAEISEEPQGGRTSSAAPPADVAHMKSVARPTDPKPAAPVKKTSPTPTENASSKARAADRPKESARREREIQRPAGAAAPEAVSAQEAAPTPQKTREMEQAELQRQRERENEEARLLWL